MQFLTASARSALVSHPFNLKLSKPVLSTPSARCHFPPNLPADQICQHFLQQTHQQPHPPKPQSHRAVLHPILKKRARRGVRPPPNPLAASSGSVTRAWGQIQIQTSGAGPSLHSACRDDRPVRQRGACARDPTRWRSRREIHGAGPLWSSVCPWAV